MSAIGTIAREFAETIREGIEWVIIWKIERSWNAESVMLNTRNNAFEDDRDAKMARAILKQDPNAIIINGWYCMELGFGKDTNIIQIAEKIRRCYVKGAYLLKETVYIPKDSDNENAEKGNASVGNTNDRNSGSNNIGDGNSGSNNTGDWNSGYENKGDFNTGNKNMGDYNTGNGNKGDWNGGAKNIGAYNSGYGNKGDHNTGHYNVGIRNSGHYNNGYGNTGEYNKTNFSNGCFNTVEPKIYLFNNPSDWTYYDFLKSGAKRILNRMPSCTTEFIEFENMTEEEKTAHPEARITGGYLKEVTDFKAQNEWWRTLPEYDKRIIKAIPNFDAEIFKEITGIEIEQ